METFFFRKSYAEFQVSEIVHGSRAGNGRDRTVLIMPLRRCPVAGAGGTRRRPPLVRGGFQGRARGVGPTILSPRWGWRGDLLFTFRGLAPTAKYFRPCGTFPTVATGVIGPVAGGGGSFMI